MAVKDFLSLFKTEKKLTDVQRAKNDYTNIENAKPQAFSYNKTRDKVSDKQWQSEFDEGKRQFNETLSFNKSKAGSSSGSGGSSGSSRSSGTRSSTSSSGSSGSSGTRSSTSTSTVPTITRKQAGKRATQILTAANYHPSNWQEILDQTLMEAKNDGISDSEVKLIAQELITAHQNDPKKTKKQKNYVISKIKSSLKDYGV